MATTVTIDNITGIWTREEGIEANFANVEQEIETPGGLSLAFLSGARAPSFTFHGEIHESSIALSTAKWRLLSELIANSAGYPFHYVQFAGQESINDGWYICSNLRLARTRDVYASYAFDLTMRKRGTLGSHRLGTVWSAAAETTSGFTTPTATSMISLPYAAASVGWAVTATHTGSDGGSSQLLENPTRSPILYQSSATIANWFLSECRVYDSVSAGDTNEANWVQVLDKHHVFGGDKIFQNAMMRYKSSGVFYAYDTTAAAWKTVGEFITFLSDAIRANPKQIEILNISPDEIRWKEWRHEGVNPLLIEYALRRGAWFCRAKITTFSLGINATYVRLEVADGYDEVFNAGANGAAGTGDLAAQTSSNYICGYNTTDDIVKGYVLCDQPGAQPYDMGVTGNDLTASLAWGVGATRTIFIIAWRQETSTMTVMANGGFEILGGGGADVFASWTESVSGTGTVADEGALVHSGSHACKLSAGTGDARVRHDSAVVANTLYNLSFWTRGDGVNAGKYAVWDATNAAWITTSTTTGITAASYSKFTTSFTAPAGCVSIEIYVIANVAASVIYFDDVNVSALATARATAAATAAYCLKSVHQELDLVPSGWYV
jgi:hypothetical protein